MTIDLSSTESYQHLPAFQRIAILLRENIFTGHLQTGQALSEKELAMQCKTSRNTLREGLRYLHSEGLVEYQHNRGVFVRQLTLDDVRDIYKTRRYIENLALQSLQRMDAAKLQEMDSYLSLAAQAAEIDDWRNFGTYSLRFHQAIVHLLDCEHIDIFFNVLLAQLRLLFASGEAEKAFQLPWLARDQQIFSLMKEKRKEQVCKALTEYLLKSEQQIISRFTYPNKGI